MQSPATNEPGEWEGHAGFNDNHVETLKEPVWETKYGVTKIKAFNNTYNEFSEGGDYFFDAGEVDEDGTNVGNAATGSGAYMVFDGASVGEQ